MNMQPRDIREFIPGKHKTVYLHESLIVGAAASLFPLPIGIFLLWFIPEMVRQSLLKQDWTGVMMAVGIGGLFGGVFTFAGLLTLYNAFDGWSSMSLEALSDRFGLPQSELIEAARAENILPRYNIKGLDVYRRGAFRSLRDRTMVGAPHPLAIRVRDVASDNRAEFLLAGVILLIVFGMIRFRPAEQPERHGPRVFISPRTHKQILLPPETPEAPEPVVGNPNWSSGSHSGF